MTRILYFRKWPGTVIGGAALLCTGLLGCSGIAHEQPSVIQQAVGTQDHQAAAQAYHQQAEVERTKAEALEHRAESLGDYVDPKGFVRSGLLTAAQSHRAKAKSLDELAAVQKDLQNENSAHAGVLSGETDRGR
jgi:hypothetical protein